MPCTTNVNQTVCVNAQVRIFPVVTPGDPITYCVDDPFIGTCGSPLQRFCTFNVSQRLCVEIPVTFDARAEATPNGIVCETEGSIGNCGGDTACTFSQGYFGAPPNAEFTENLIETAEDNRIILGELGVGDVPEGLSIIVDTTNYDGVFAGTQPPIPTTIVLASRLGQYRNLYQQLLAANLNVLNGATCAAALEAIADANTFLANSPDEGMDGADIPALRLENFNVGSIPGCPDHCPSTND